MKKIYFTLFVLGLMSFTTVVNSRSSLIPVEDRQDRYIQEEQYVAQCIDPSTEICYLVDNED